jgi:hypothetical protein
LRIAPSPVNKKLPSRQFAMRSWGDQVVFIVRASNEGLLRPHVARAQGIVRPPFSSLYSFSPSPLHIVGGPTGCLSGHQGLVAPAVAELKRPAIGRWRRCSPFHSSIAWNGTKLRCQAAGRLTAANKALASSESSRSVRLLPLLHLILSHPYNVFP